MAPRPLSVVARLAVLLLFVCACHREGPRVAATSDAPDLGPTPEEFCAHVDRLSARDLADATPDEKRAAHVVCVEASTEDRARFPEWAPCARCTMEVSSMDSFDQRCASICAPLQAKMQALASPDASAAD